MTARKLQAIFITALSLAAGNLFACTMVGPAAGIYSGGIFLAGMVKQDGPRILTSAGLLLLAVVLFKSAVFARLMRRSALRFFFAMIVANIVTTILGIVVEIIHISAGMIILLPAALLTIPLFILPVNVLRPLPSTPAWVRNNRALPVLLLTLLFMGISILGTFLQNGLDPDDHPVQLWGWKLLFGIGSLSITLLLTATYELAVIRKTTRHDSPELLPNVLKANLLVYAILFTGIIIMTTLPVFS